MASLLFFVAIAGGAIAIDHCWKDSYSLVGQERGLHTCRSGWEQSGLLCYPNCKSGYGGNGPVCWEFCPDGWRDDGAFCNNRGGEVINADNSGCPWYDLCGLTFARGCSSCPSGYTNDGCTCRKPIVTTAKKSYGRGVGEAMGCGSDEVQGGLLCYPQCQDRDGMTYYQDGPTCWQQCDGTTTPTDKGLSCCKGRGCDLVFPSSTGCEPCCNDLTSECLACQLQLTEEEFCVSSPSTMGCEEPTMMPTRPPSEDSSEGPTMMPTRPPSEGSSVEPSMMPTRPPSEGVVCSEYGDKGKCRKHEQCSWIKQEKRCTEKQG